jgi:hypothetical protein
LAAQRTDGIAALQDLLRGSGQAARGAYNGAAGFPEIEDGTLLAHDPIRLSQTMNAAFKER